MNTRLVCFANSAISIEWADDPSYGLVDFLFKSVPASGPADAHVHYTLRHDPSRDTFHLTSDHPGDKKSAARGRMAHYLMERVTFHLADRSHGGMLFHAACLVKNGSAILMPGTSGSGKSTLTVWFTQQGWHYLTDEMAFIPENTQSVQGLTRPVHLKEKITELFPDLDLSTALAVRPENLQNCAWLLPPAMLNAEPVETQAMDIPNVRLILFPRFSSQVEFEVSRLSASDAAIRLTASLTNARNLPDHGFPRVLQAVRDLPALSFTYNRFPTPAELSRLILS